MSEAGLAIGLVRSTQELAETEWAKEWGALTEVDDRANGFVRIPGPPWRFSRSTLPSPVTPAYQGEHNAEILAERTIAETVIDDLRQRRVLLSRHTPRGTDDLSPHKTLAPPNFLSTTNRRPCSANSTTNGFPWSLVGSMRRWSARSASCGIALAQMAKQAQAH